jgi:hypothetical protein
MTNEMWIYDEWTLHHPMYLCVKCVFNTWHPCMKYMNQYEQISHIVLIIKLLNVKFVLCCIHQGGPMIGL